MSAAHTLREEGNAFFKAGDFASAEGKYTDALNAPGLFESCCSDNLLSRNLLGNRAAARIKLEDHEGGLADANAAISIDRFWDKAWFRKGVCLLSLPGCDYDAGVAFCCAAELNPADVEVRQHLEACIRAEEAWQGCNLFCACEVKREGQVCCSQCAAAPVPERRATASQRDEDAPAPDLSNISTSTAPELFRMLCAISKSDSRSATSGDEREAFLANAFKNKTKEIGQRLFDLGDLELMRAVHEDFAATVRKDPVRNADGVALSCVFNGIGGWLH